MLQATKVRLYPTNEQKEFLSGQFGAVRFCFNRSVALKKKFICKERHISFHYQRIEAVVLNSKEVPQIRLACPI